jgi:predicted membrane-bound mannosyltransferase
MGKKAILWVIILGLISAGVIFYKFNQIPSHLDLDEAEFARLAISLYKEPLTIFSPYATGHATPYFYLILASFLTFGLNTFALRLPSALFGFLNPFLVFLISIMLTSFLNLLTLKM